MKKKFNITGVCYPHMHYMMDNSDKMRQIMEMVEQGDYFVINRPRQYGKTTTLHSIANLLANQEDYLAVRLTLEDAQDEAHQSDVAFAEMFLDKLSSAFEYLDKNLQATLEDGRANKWKGNKLSKAVTDMAHATDKKLVLLIDEVDASSNYSSFLRFLAMLRSKYLDRFMPQNKTFHSVVLTGVHDVKSLKYKLRLREEAEYNSPWNIAADFEVDMSFNPQEIASMLRQAGSSSFKIPVLK